MKANELMLGDWVYGLYTNGKRYEPPFRISAVDIYPTNRSPRIVTEGGYGFQEEHLAPIPLTPEILEKNGIKYNAKYENPYFEYEPTEEELKEEEKNYPFTYYRSEDFLVDVSFYPQSITMSVRSVDYRTRVEIRRDKIYVHELQHSIRLCGIEKEITL